MYTIRIVASKIKNWLGFGEGAIYKGHYGDKGWEVMGEVLLGLRMIGEECLKKSDFGLLSDVESLIRYLEDEIETDCYVKEIGDE